MIGFARKVTCLALVIIAAPLHAAVSAQLSAQNIDELETVRLTIKITETRQTETLDLSALERDFHVMGQNTVSQSRFLNGRGQSWVDYQITLQPKRTGTLKIPGIEVGGQRTPSLELRVNPLSAETRDLIDDLVFFEIDVSARTIYVQSQLVLTRRLLYSQGVQLYSDLPGAPEIADAVVLSLGETSSGTTERGGKTYGVVQQRYAIFPETSGSLRIPAISITASVRLLENNRVSRKGVRVATDEVLVDVLGVPAAYPADAPWLPAEHVEVLAVVSPERGEHKVGDTLTHELLVHVRGNIGSVSPPLPLTLNRKQFRTYPLGPVINDDTNSETVKGSRLQTTSIVPLQPGRLVVPAAELIWWDTAAEQVRISRSQPLTLQVSGVAITPATQPAPEPARREVEPEALDETVAANIPWGTWASWLLAIVALAALAWAARLAWRFRAYLRPGAYRQVKQALDAADPRRVHAALGSYLAEQYGCPGHLAFGRLRASSPEVARVLDRIERSLYGDQAPSPATLPADEVAILRNALRSLRFTPRQARSDPLPPLYSFSMPGS